MSWEGFITPTVHLKLQPEDMAEYVICCGSSGRAREISKRLINPREIPNPRGMHCFVGDYDLGNGQTVRVLVVPHGMGDPSAAIIFYELIGLAKIASKSLVMLRVGTSGSLQDYIKAGQTVIVQATVRDEHTMASHVPPEFPAIATLEVLDAQREAARSLGMHCPVVISHTKDDLNRELKMGNVPLAPENRRYMEMLEAALTGVSSMEEAALFILAWLNLVWAGSFLKVIGDNHEPFDPNKDYPMEDTFDVTFQTITILEEQRLAA